jgi:dipeptidyl aminopeptidase/acylaminoacyl peptidase
MTLRLKIVRHFAIALTALSVAGPLLAQQRVFTAADYDRGARFLAQNMNGLVVGGTVQATWLPDERFTYRSQTADGGQFFIVDPAKKTRTLAFDHAKIATALSTASGQTYTAQQLPFQQVDLSAKADSIGFDLNGRRWSCDAVAAKCTDTGEARGARGAGAGGRGGRGGGGGGRGGALANAAFSPDGSKAAFIRDWNLWVRDVASGQEKQLTTDGVKDFGYATDNAGWAGSDRAILLWSPDSKKIATQQQDERKVGDMYLVNTKVGHPELRAWKYPLPGDSVVAMVHRVIIEVETGKVVRLQMPPDFHRATLGDNISMNDYNWSPDGSKLALVSTSRDHKAAVLKVADASTGAVRTVMEETVQTHFESRTGWRVLWPTNEVVWYSQRDDWGQLYLYDLNTGKLKNKITNGDGPVTQIARIDEKTRTIWYAANGRETGQDPYFRHFYRTGLDGKSPQVSLTPDDGDHDMQLSPSGKFIVDTYSRADAPPIVNVRDGSSKVVMEVEKADISRLLATGWKPPIRITMKAADGKTDIYGLMFVPTTLDPTKKYPIINNAYPGPQSGSVGSRSFTMARGDRQALAELGFVVVTIDGRGTPGRSKSFHDSYYGAMGRDNTIPDQVAGMKDLAQRYSYIDIDKAAMWGHSGGGFITAGAMFRFPDFFKVGIAESGNHDQRNYEDDWGERYQGLLERNGGTDSYDVEANQTLAKNLKGKLLLAHGTMDNNVPPSNTLLVVDALIKANKDFDLIEIPNAGHGFGGASNYMMRRRWDYFVKHLLGAEPPKEYEFRPLTRPVGDQ